jgi:aromatic-L-amino-acid decarboxylase
VVHGRGLSGLRAHVRGHVALAAELADRVRADPGFALAAEPSLALVCLRVVTGAGPEADDAASREVLARVNGSGAAFLTHTAVGGRYVIRVAIGAVTTRAEHVDQLWERLRAEADEVRAAYRA